MSKTNLKASIRLLKKDFEGEYLDINSSTHCIRAECWPSLDEFPSVRLSSYSRLSAFPLRSQTLNQS